MKRTFGKILSFALVLAMVLSMVPAVLAASATDTNAYLAPGFDETFTYSYTGTGTGTAPDMSQLFWVSGNEKVATVTNTTDGSSISKASQTVTAVAAGSTTISVWKNQEDYNKNKNNYYSSSALKTWNVTVTGWKVVLSFSGSNSGWYGSGSSTGTTINAGSKATLTATVTGPAGKVENAKVKFTTADKTIALLDNNSNNTQVTKPVSTTSSNWGSSSATTGTATVDVYGGTMGGYVDITATVMVGNTVVNLSTNRNLGKR